jgi:hypothetical protein
MLAALELDQYSMMYVALFRDVPALLAQMYSKHNHIDNANKLPKLKKGALKYSLESETKDSQV